MTAYLVIDTSTRYGTVGLWSDGLSRAATWRSRNNHTSELMPAVQWLLDAEGLSPSGLDGITVAVGPGGFSALRTGLGVAKGLALAASLQIAGVSSLEAMAYAWRDSAVRVCALLSVGRDAVAWGAFGSTGGVWQALSGEQVSTVEEFAHAQSDGETLFCGEASDAVRGALRDRLGDNARFAAEPSALIRLAGAAELGAALFAAGKAGPAAAVEPRYLRAPAITQPNKPSRVRYGSGA